MVSFNFENNKLRTIAWEQIDLKGCAADAKNAKGKRSLPNGKE